MDEYEFFFSLHFNMYFYFYSIWQGFMIDLFVREEVCTMCFIEQGTNDESSQGNAFLTLIL